MEAGLHLGNKDGKLRAMFAVDGNSLVVLDLKNERSESHAVLYVTAITEERPTGSLILLNNEGKVVWRAPSASG